MFSRLRDVGCVLKFIMFSKVIFFICVTLALTFGKAINEAGIYTEPPHLMQHVDVVSALRLLVQQNNDIGDEAMQNPDLFEGDILGFEPGDRNAVVEKYRVWPNGKIPYTIDPLLKEHEPLIKQAMQHYADKTCIRFEPRTDQNQYVRIFKGRGCYSHVGKTLSDQPLSLGPGCYKLPLILHELGHAIGFYHEHSRSDRDDYLNIHYENIQKGMEDQFVKLKPKQNQLLTPFDFDSIMLYGETVFSKSHYDGLKTMTAKDGRKLKDVTDKPGISDSDVERITKLYNC